MKGKETIVHKHYHFPSLEHLSNIVGYIVFGVIIMTFSHCHYKVEEAQYQARVEICKQDKSKC